MKYFRKSDVTVILIIVFIEAGLIAWYFSLGSFLSHNRSEIATVTFKNNIATRRQADVFHWQNLKNGSTLYEYDTLHTAENSGATIHFPDKTELGVSDNSIIRLGGLNKDGFANVETGNISLTTTGGKPKTIVIKGKSVTLSEDAKVVLKTTADGETQLEVQSGTASIVDGDRKINLSQLQTVKISQDEKPAAVKTVPAMAVDPAHGNKFILFEGADARVPFRFASTDIAKVTLLVAEDSAFTNIISTVHSFNKETEKNMYRCDVALPSKKVYWKLVFTDGTESEVQSLTVEKTPSPATVLQDATATVVQTSGKPGIRFTWNQVAEASSYLFELSKAADFKASETKKVIANTFTQVSELEAGDYYWRVTPQYPNQTLGVVEPVVHRITVEGTNELAAVKTIFPAQNYTLKLDSLEKSNFVFSWQPHVLADTYILKFYDEHKTVQETFIVDSNTVSLRSLNSKMFREAGKMFWSVSYKTADAKTAPESSLAALNKSNELTDFRAIFPKDDYTIAQSLMQHIRFTWENKTDKTTLFTIAKDDRFTDIAVEKKVDGTSFLGTYLPEGNYFWRVQLLNSEGVAEATSEVNRFAVVSNLDAADITFPKENDIIPLIKNAVVPLTWQPVAHADYYEVSVYDTNGNRIIYQPFATGEPIPISISEYSEGTFVARVQALSYDTMQHTKNIGLVADRMFSSKEIEFITLVSPHDRLKIRGEDSLNDGIIFKWTTDPVIGNAVFQLKKNGRVVKNIPSKKAGDVSLRVSDLTAGSYSWQVLGEFMGYEISSKQQNAFTVLPIKPLEKPLFITAKQQETVNVPYLEKTRVIHFEWTPVKWADYYLFTIKNPQGNTVFTQKMHGSALDFEELKLLSNGTFKASVQAVSTTIVKKRKMESEMSTYSFIVDLPIIKKPTQDVGATEAEYYGY